jgi:TonB family protein
MKAQLCGGLLALASVPMAFAQQEATPPAAEKVTAAAPRTARSIDEVTIMLLIDVDSLGRPFNIMVEQTSGDLKLDRAAINAAKKWKFPPKKENGRNVPDRIRVPVGFKTGG